MSRTPAEEGGGGARLTLVEPPDSAALVPSAAAGQPLAVSRRLEALRDELEAVGLTLVRFERKSASFEVVASIGRPFLATRVRLPLSASMVVLEASEGRSAHVSAERSWYPLDRIAVSVGLRCAMGIPLSESERPIGALTVVWDVEPPPVSDPATVVEESCEELIGVLSSFEGRQRIVLVCHEDRLLAGGLARLVEQQLGAAVDVAHTLDAALAALAARPPDVIVCSDHLSAEEPLPAVAAKLRAADSAAPLLALARTETSQSFQDALEAGATGYLPLARAAENLPDTAGALLDGRTVLPPRRAATPGPHLTDRERQVLLGFENGLSDKEIAADLGVAISTVKTHARAIYTKLDAPSRTAALHKARVLGLL